MKVSSNRNFDLPDRYAQLTTSSSKIFTLAKLSWRDILGIMNTLLLLSAITLGSGGLISLLIWLLVFALVVYCIFLVLGLLPLPEPAKRIVTIILAVILLLALLNHLGIVV